MSASAPVAGSSLCVLERSVVARGSCWVGGIAVGATLGGAVGLAGARLGCGMVVLWMVGIGSAGGVYGWNRGVMGWMISGTSVGGVVRSVWSGVRCWRYVVAAWVVIVKMVG